MALVYVYVPARAGHSFARCVLLNVTVIRHGRRRSDVARGCEWHGRTEGFKGALEGNPEQSGATGMRSASGRFAVGGNHEMSHENASEHERLIRTVRATSGCTVTEASRLKSR